MKIVQSSQNQVWTDIKNLFCIVTGDTAIEKSGSLWNYDNQPDKYFNTFILEFR
jgi:hypothetical protein